MIVRCILPVALFAFVAGCGMTANGVTNAQNSVNTAVITGVVHLPEGMVASKTCQTMSIQALHGGAPIGQSVVRESMGRCLYELSHLPANVEVSVQVSLPVCGTGGAAAVAPVKEPVRLKKNETRTRDFWATCEVPGAPPAT